MKRKTISIVALCAIFLSVPSAKATGFLPGSVMVEGRIASTPFGFKNFCRVEKEHCDLYRKANIQARQPLSMTSALWSELEAVNSSVNAEIQPIPEFGLFSRKDEWKIPTSNGDCEDFALLKQSRLIEKGWPKQALLITVAELPEGGRHAVLTVRTEQGDLILDNITDDILHWQEADYRWVKRQSARDMMRWVEIKSVQVQPTISINTRKNLISGLII